MDAGIKSSPPLDIEYLYGEHHGWLKGWLRTRTGNSADAADLAQDTFVRMLTLRQLPVLREPRHYLATIARGLLIDKARRQTLERAYLEVLAARPEPLEVSPETYHLIIESLLAIDTLLDGLGARTRQIFLMVQLEGLSYVQVGRQLGLSVTTVKNHLGKALLQCILLMED
ncbi:MULTISPECIES: sigma-70 family RNA polymerase sigma factor [Pseudomonas]|jgi:RNA polymerase sigma factor (sigma-70 family)|uniref:sigma-70 family RNA polymerase sigma factor n=1 Tax=Pseudomonas TaxID=286 RepID=UPI000687F11E|nr:MULTISPECIES: sigma-70 family RNA polymerase sigma factor [Pseudomonas]PRA52938.1 RNA polymerase subunit sigma [Pseudomonas sp. MYb115]QXN49456.1 sigma-70 family RNA polymerase sigma factor [Pseudomonas fluorescens]WSO23771.1 sigma-70 family RNA polymerase sigma factor [Pseudomonas fluorescens]